MDVEYHGKYQIHWIAEQPLDLETLLIGNFFVFAKEFFILR